MKKVLITGGCGFIGSELATHLSARPDLDILIYDRIRSECTNYFNSTPLTLVDSSIPIVSVLDKHKPTAVVHLGAKSATDLVDIENTYANNVLLTNTLIDYSIYNNIKLLYASSASTYGDGSSGFLDTHDFSELTRYKPLNIYAWSKHNSDLYFARRLSQIRNHSNIAGLKFFNVFGRNESHKKHMASVPHQFLSKIRNGESVNLFKLPNSSHNAEAKRDFISSVSILRLIEELLEIDFPSSIYNVGSGIARPFSALVDLMYKSCGHQPNYSFVELPDKYRGKYQEYTCADITRIKELCPLFPYASIEESILYML